MNCCVYFQDMASVTVETVTVLPVGMATSVSSSVTSARGIANGDARLQMAKSAATEVCLPASASVCNPRCPVLKMICLLKCSSKCWNPKFQNHFSLLCLKFHCNLNNHLSRKVVCHYLSKNDCFKVCFWIFVV